MMPNAVIRELVTQKMESEIERAERLTVARALIQPDHRGLVHSVRHRIGVALIAAGCRIQGSLSDRVQPAAATRL